MSHLCLTYGQANNSSSSSSSIGIDKRTLIRTAGPFPANTTIDLNSPGNGWFSSGDSLTFSGASDFVNNSQVYRNGQLLLTGESSSTDNDVYFVSAAANVAFEFTLIQNDVIQIWRFTTSSG